jgi:hypothetical protein
MSTIQIEPKAAENDEQGQCIHCGRNNRGYEGQPCADDCPLYWEIALNRRAADLDRDALHYRIAGDQTRASFAFLAARAYRDAAQTIGDDDEEAAEMLEGAREFERACIKGALL